MSAGTPSGYDLTHSLGVGFTGCAASVFGFDVGLDALALAASFVAGFAGAGAAAAFFTFAAFVFAGPLAERTASVATGSFFDAGVVPLAAVFAVGAGVTAGALAIPFAAFAFAGAPDGLLATVLLFAASTVLASAGVLALAAGFAACFAGAGFAIGAPAIPFAVLVLAGAFTGLLAAAVLTPPADFFEAGAAVFATSDAACALARLSVFTGVVSFATLTSQLFP